MITSYKTGDRSVECDVKGNPVDLIMELSAATNAVIDVIVEATGGRATRENAAKAVFDSLKCVTDEQMINTVKEVPNNGYKQ